MTKQDWIEYFEVINGRSPLPEEIARALARGEFTQDDTILDVQGAPNGGAGVVPPVQGQMVNQTAPTGMQGTPNPAFANQGANQVPNAGMTPNQGMPQTPLNGATPQGMAQAPLDGATPQTAVPQQAPAQAPKTNQGVGQAPLNEATPQGVVPNQVPQAIQGVAQTPVNEASSQAVASQHVSGQAPQANQGRAQAPLTGATSQTVASQQSPNQANPASNPVQSPISQAQSFATPEKGYYQTNPAMPNGMAQSPVTKPKRPKKKKRLLVWIPLVIIVIVALAGGGYSGWRLHSGNITGVWQLDKTYIASAKTWQDSDDLNYMGYMTVNKDKTVKLEGYYKSGSDVGFTSDSFVGPMFKVDQWNKQMDVTISKSSYESKIKTYTKDKLNYSSSSAKETAEGFADKFEDNISKCDISYQVKGDTLTVTYKKPDGKVLKKERYHRLTESKTNDVKKELKDFQEEFEENQKKANNS